MKVRIYRPTRNTMQSGRSRVEGKWFLEYELQSSRVPEPLMGWSSSEDTLNQVRLKFDSSEDAVSYAQKKGWEYSVQEQQQRKVIPRNYGDNFIYNPPKD